MLGFGAKKTGGAHDEERIDDLSPQLNEALREEIVEYLKFGFDALFDTEFEKTRDPLKDQITIFIDPSEALRDDESETGRERGSSLSSTTSSWFSHHSVEDEATTKSQQKMVYRDSAYLPPATPDVPDLSSTSSSTRNMELKDVVVVVKDEDEEEEKTQSETTPSLHSPSMLRRHLSAAIGEDTLMEDVVITAGTHKLKSASHVVFQEKLTSIFQNFRKQLGIEKTFRSEMRQISAGMETNGRSGSFFFFTQRKLFCLKTMSKKEYEVLTRLVKPGENSDVMPYTEYVHSFL